MATSQEQFAALERFRALRNQIAARTPPVKPRQVSDPDTVRAVQGIVGASPARQERLAMREGARPTVFVDGQGYMPLGGSGPRSTTGVSAGRTPFPGRNVGVGRASSGVTTGGAFGSSLMEGGVPQPAATKKKRPLLAARPMIGGQVATPEAFASAWQNRSRSIPPRTVSMQNASAPPVPPPQQGNAAYGPDPFGPAQAAPQTAAAPPMATATPAQLPSSPTAATAPPGLRPDQLAKRQLYADQLAARKEAAREQGIARGQAMKERIAMRRGGPMAGGGPGDGDQFERYLAQVAMNAPNQQAAVQAGRMLTDIRNQRMEGDIEKGKMATQKEIAQGGWASAENIAKGESASRLDAAKLAAEEKRFETMTNADVQRESQRLQADAARAEREGNLLRHQQIMAQQNRLAAEAARRDWMNNQQQQREFGLTYQQQQQQHTERQSVLQQQLEEAKRQNRDIPEEDKITSVAQQIFTANPAMGWDAAVDQARRGRGIASGTTPLTGTRPQTPERMADVASRIEAIASRPGITPEILQNELAGQGITQDDIRNWANENAEGWWGRQWRTGTLGSLIRTTRPTGVNEAERRRISLIEQLSR